MADPLVPAYNQRERVIQPQLIRSRVPYRSPLRSEQVNLEAEQLRFDFTNLKAKLDLLNSDLDRILEELVEIGSTIPAPYSAVSDSLEELLSKVSSYEGRIRNLEQKKGLR